METEAAPKETTRSSGYDLSRWNAVKYGVEMHAILPARGADRCVYSEECTANKNAALDAVCRDSLLCPVEVDYYRQYVASTRRQFKISRRWLGKEQWTKVIHDLAILSLRRIRLGIRITHEGFFRMVPDQYGHSEWPEPTPSVNRYGAAIDNAFDEALDKLFCPPGGPEELDRILNEKTWQVLERLREKRRSGTNVS